MSADESAEKRKWVRLTRACNNHCIFCLDEEAKNGTFLPFKTVLENLEEGFKNGCKRAVLSGGDPSIHPDFHKIVKAAKDTGYRHIQAITNGRMFCYPEFIVKAVQNGLSEITFSIHAPEPQLNDMLTGAKGSFIQSITALRNALRIPGLTVNCDIVVNALNVDILAKHLRFLYSLGIREFDILHIMPFGLAWRNWDRLYYDPFAKKKELFSAFQLAENKEVHLWTNRFPADLFEGNEHLIQSPFKLLDEVRGRKTVFENFRKGIPMECAGKRCSFCPLRNFCSDLKELIKQDCIKAFSMPECLGGRKINKKIYADAPVEDIAAFYIEYRHFIKSSHCARCTFNSSCKGASVLFLKEKGFAVLSPVVAGTEADTKKRSVENAVPQEQINR